MWDQEPFKQNFFPEKLEELYLLEYFGWDSMDFTLKIFENLLPENIKKSDGTFYTPRSVVNYICDESIYNYLLIFLSIFLIYGFPQYLFQEYLEPLIIFIFFSGMLKIYLKDVFNKNIGITNLTTITYFSLYLVVATYYDLMR